MSGRGTTLDEVAAAARTAELRAGGSDVMDLRRRGVRSGPLVDLLDVPGLDAIERDGGGLRLGAAARVQAIGSDPLVRTSHRGLAEAAAGLATPQLRAVGTLGGNLCQDVRCDVFRFRLEPCHRTGVPQCPARRGDGLDLVAFDLGPCAAPHASTLGVALLAWDAAVDVHAGESRSIAELYGDGSDPSRPHQLAPGEVITAVRVPGPERGEVSAWFRAISRARAEWPLAEVVVRLARDAAGDVTFARVTAGGVAPIPIRLRGVEETLVGGPASPERLAAAARRAGDGARPVPGTRHGVDVLVGATLTILEMAAERLVATTEEAP